MPKFVRYTCNKKNEPVYREDCLKCHEYNPCAKDGKWCFVGALVSEYDHICAEAGIEAGKSAAMPVLRDMSTITINFGNGMKAEVLREEIKKQLERDFYKGLMIGG